MTGVDEGPLDLGDSELFETRLGAAEGADVDGDDARLMPEELVELEELELGPGLLGTLLGYELELPLELDELDSRLGGGAGGGLLDALLGVCCARRTVEQNNRTAAIEEPERRIKHLLANRGRSFYLTSLRPV